ncbi:hypothetical protein ACN267_26535 [Micromonospora sp. WMMD734]|uniref:hypothetical protein n=1 Tax=unclassified Micromonospora TaxID=2617518 RepID=UPI003B94DF0C
MDAVRRYLKTPASSAIGMLAAAVAFGGATVGLFVLAEHVRYHGYLGRLVAVIGFYFAGGGALIVTLLLLVAGLGPNLTAKLFFVPNRMLTPEAVRDLKVKEAAPGTVPITPRQGVLRVIPVKPEWWLDEDASTHDAAPVVAVEGIEYRLPGWDPYDVAVPAGAVDVVAWVPRRNGSPGRRVRNSIPVPEGRVGALVFRPSSLPELPGTVEPLNSELRGTLSLFRLALAAAALIAFVYTAWRLTSG